MQQRFPVLIAALWWGSLGVIGFMAVPLLFAYLPTPAQAGQMAARLFAAQTWLSVVCCLGLLLLSRPRGSTSLAPWATSTLAFILGGMLLALLVQFGIAPRIVARQDLRLWHSVGTAMYVAQWLCAAWVLWRVAAKR